MASTVQNAKLALRQEMKQILSLLSMNEKRIQSTFIANRLIHHPKYQSAKRIGIYLSLPDEVETESILEHMFSVGKLCFIPKYNSDTMDMVQLNSLEERNVLPKTKWNISQPAKDSVREDALQTGGLDLIIVPGRAFTKCGYRLGRGKGYYDIYFSRYKEKFNGQLPFTIGLAFVQQLLENVPVTDTDQKLDDVLFDHRNSDETFNEN